MLRYKSRGFLVSWNSKAEPVISLRRNYQQRTANRSEQPLETSRTSLVVLTLQAQLIAEGLRGKSGLSSTLAPAARRRVAASHQTELYLNIRLDL